MSSTEDKPEAAASPAPEEKPAAESAPFAGAGGQAFAGFSAAAKEKDGGGDEDEHAEEEDCKAEFAPVVQLDLVETTTGEEEETTLFEKTCKLYRMDHSSNEWKERGIGQCRILQHKQTKLIRLLMRQDKTLKIRANHIIMPGTTLKPHAGNDKAWVWSTVDFADEEQKVELFAVRFGQVETAQDFKKKMEEGMENNEQYLGEAVSTTGADESKEAANALAEEVESKAKVEESAES